MNPIAIDAGLRTQPSHRCHDVVRENVKILQVLALRFAGAALVESKRGETVRRIEIRLVVVVDRAVRLRTMDDHDSGVRAGTVSRRVGQHHLAPQLQVAAREHRRALGQIDVTRVHDLVIGASPIETRPAGTGAIELDLIDDRRALIPARAALVFAVACRPQHCAFAVHQAVAQDLALARSDEDQGAIR